ncbi:MAG: hypothetical protein D4R45_03060 [Planctomycetaceae bacterium]|nr:MAG: hypothetical protein D4R45_03060 [Planctomycetaceae bacterium]
MDSQDLIIIGHRAKIETEAFINRNLNDRAKGWPKSCLCGPNYADYCQEGQVDKRNISGMLLRQ